MSRVTKPVIMNIPSKLANGRGYRKSQEPKKQVIHAMAQYVDFEGEEDKHAKQFLDSVNLAAHFLVESSGVIIQTLEIDVIGAHAKNNNTGTVGIELLVGGSHTYPTFIDAIKEPYCTEEQYKALVHLSGWLISEGVNDMIRHSELDPSRKRDPGDGFDWNQFRQDVADYIETGSFGHLEC